MRLFRYIIFSLFFASAGWAQTQESNANANEVFALAIQLYTRSQDLDGAEKKRAAIEVLRIFDLILTAYPDSIPGKRIKDNVQVGPININALRELAGIPTDEENTVAAVQEPETETPVPEEPEVLEWYQKVLPSGAPEGGFGHGAYPSVGQRTHPGIDLISACGAEITSPIDAVVEKVVNAGDPAFPQTGNAIVLRYETVRLAFFFLGSAPLVREGNVAEGQAIGTTGPLHGLDTCGTHFEVRLFGEDETLIMPLWHNVLAVGNWRDAPAFTASWRNPEEWLTRLGQEKIFAPLLLAQKGAISIYYSRFLGAYNQPQRLFSRSPESEQGLTIDRSIVVSRVLKHALRLELKYLYARVNRDATENVIRPSDRLAFRFRATLVNLDTPEEIILSRNTGVDSRLANGVFARLEEPSIITFPEAMLKQADIIRLELVASDGKVFSLGPDISLETTEPDTNDLEALVGFATRILDAFNRCPNVESQIPGQMTYTFYAREAPQDKIYNLVWLDYSDVTRLRAQTEFRRMSRAFAACGALEVTKPTNLSRPSLPLEIVSGRSAQ